MSPKYYKDYRVGSIEKEIIKRFLGVNNITFAHKKLYDETWSDIFETARQKSEMPVIFSRLEKKGMVRFLNTDGILTASLTAKGSQYLKENFLHIKKPADENKIWDGKWHIVIFDIPVARTKTRNILRFHLKKIGFVQIQGSVWVYPYECNELVTLIKTNFKLNEEVVYIVANNIEGEGKFMKLFKVSRK